MKKSLIIVLPVYNEEKDLGKNLPILHNFATHNLSSYQWQIVIAEQASTDKTLSTAQKLANIYPNVTFFHRNEKGRGGALKEAWKTFSADYYAYTDIDLSSQLQYLPKLFHALDNQYSIAIGSRLNSESKVSGRTFFREILSRVYNILIRSLFFVHFLDAQCGFKAVTKEAVQNIMPHVKNNNWFFDSELLILAERTGYRIKVVPIEWKDDPHSTVRVLKTALEDLKGLCRLFVQRPWKHIAPPDNIFSHDTK